MSAPDDAVGRGGTPSGCRFALLILTLLLTISLPVVNSAEKETELLGPLMCCVLGALAVLYPVLAGILLGAGLTLMAFLDPGAILSMSIISFPIAIVITTMRGRRLIARLLAFWYLVVTVGTTVRYSAKVHEIILGAIFWVVFMLGSVFLGEFLRRIVQGAERQRRAQALATERQRRAIARELHDTLVYATTTMVMKAEEARMRGGLDGQTLTDLDFIANTGRSATADLRTMLVLLRDSESVSEPVGVLRTIRLEEVIHEQREKLEAFGFQVNLDVSGDPAALPERLSAVVARVLTEVASNITKHGDSTYDIAIMMDLDGPEVEAIFANRIAAVERSSGHKVMGLLGLQEIVAAEGGELESGPMGECWVTHLTLPRP